jgi:uncharacterized membrane protein YuzA (DUF378 family)
MGWIDGPTLLLLLATAISVGLYGVFGVDVVGYVVEDTYRHYAYLLVGFAGLWQLIRQPWWS